MTDYERGFAEGERCAYRDRQDGRIRFRPNDLMSSWACGFWDAYQPRTPVWALKSQAARSWHDTPEEIEA
jgi:hypothetical protein